MSLPSLCLLSLPVARMPLHPRPLHVARRRARSTSAPARLTAEVPHRIHVVVLGQHFRERFFGYP